MIAKRKKMLHQYSEKNVNNLKRYVPTVPVIMSFNDLKRCSCGKIIYFCLLACGKEISNWKNWKDGRLDKKKFMVSGPPPPHPHRNIMGDKALGELKLYEGSNIYYYNLIISFL